MSKYNSILSGIGAVLLFVGLAIKITNWVFAPYIYLVGAILFAYVQVMDSYDGNNIIIKRLRRQQILGASILVLTGVIMLLCRHNEWIASLAIASILELYTAFRIPQEMGKKNSHTLLRYILYIKNSSTFLRISR